MTGKFLALVLLFGAGAATAQDLLAVRTLRPGTVVASSDLRPARDNLAGTARLDRQVEAIVGLEVRRAIYAGRAVTAGDLGPPTLVERNAIVTMIFRRNGLMIRTEGRALDRGGLGERVRVMNLASRESVIGTIRRAGLVEVGR